MSYDEIYSKLKNVGQEQLLDFYDELNDEEKENLLKQIEKIDFSILDLINHQNEEKKKGVIIFSLLRQYRFQQTSVPEDYPHFL